MWTHSTIGEQTMPASRLPEAERIARVKRHHHENFAGDVYPDGREGDSIPYTWPYPWTYPVLEANCENPIG